MEKKKVKEWLDMAFKNVCNPGDIKDIHIDDLLGLNYSDSKNMFEGILKLAKQIQANFADRIIDGYILYIYIALDSDSNAILGVPRDYVSLLNRIDINYPPELVLYKVFERDSFSKIELYKSCLPFNIEFNDSIEITYRELRSYENLIADESFTRELHITIK